MLRLEDNRGYLEKEHETWYRPMELFLVEESVKSMKFFQFVPSSRRGWKMSPVRLMVWAAAPTGKQRSCGNCRISCSLP
jgi:hypothetical protein